MKKNLVRMALAGALAFGVASVSKAAEEAVAAPVWSGVAQELDTQTFGTKSATSTTSNAVAGDANNATLQHVQLGVSAGIDALDTLTVKTELGTGALTLLDAYDTHSLADLNAGLAFKAGQVKVPFGADSYSNPDQLIRTGYSSIDSLVPAGKLTNGNTNLATGTGTVGSVYDLGLEVDQTFSDLTLQVAVVQNGSLALSPNQVGNKDYVGRAQWKSSNVVLGLSDYYSSTATATGTNSPNNTNTLGANASVMVDVFQLDLEAIFGNAGTNGYTGTLSAKFNGIQPAAWYEFTTLNSAPATGNTGVLSNDLGAGINFWLGAKTRLALDVDFTGNNTALTPAADLLAVNTETVQLTESF
jgi:hypothetical protein